MIKHKMIKLNEQKYIGIKTRIMFAQHDEIDFSQFHKDVIDSLIGSVSAGAPFMACDTDFTKESFSYVPMVPVSDYSNMLEFECFSVEAGMYYAFDVTPKECNPAWFTKVFEYIKDNGLKIENTNYDLELFSNDYIARRMEGDYTQADFSNEVYSVIFKKAND